LNRFADEAFIEVASGKGGDGSAAFRREKYVPRGGPAGGDGGRGGDVVFTVRYNLRTLSHLRYEHTFKAENGHNGEGSQRNGRAGTDIIIPVPPGTALKPAPSATNHAATATFNHRPACFIALRMTRLLKK
jgi:GTP-binding protein